MDYCSFDMGPIVMLPNPKEPWQLEEYRNPMTVEVAEIGSFEEYCKGHFGWEWFEGLRLRLAEKMIPAGKTSAVVPAPDVVFLEGAEILRIEFSRMDRHHIYADAIITANIELMQNINGCSKTDRVSQWYRDRFIFEVFPGGYNLTEQSVTIYDSKEKCPGQPLTEYLVPVLDEEALEQEAEDMLRLYYPEAFMQPIPIDGVKLAERMGLSVFDVPLLSEQEIMGQSVFLDGTVQVTDGEQRKAQMKVCPNMILVNTNCRMNELQRNDTIIHECVHHYEHDLFVWGQSLYRNDIYGIDCPVIEGAFALEGQSPMRWAEMQARLLTYRLKMNRLQMERVIQKTEQEVCGYSVPMEKGRFKLYLTNRARNCVECCCLLFEFSLPLKPCRSGCREPPSRRELGQRYRNSRW